jgi:diguanylate cyclase (GGDEF)-like protein
MEAALAILAVITVAAVVMASRSSIQARRARAVIARLDNVDPLTGLANRNQLRTQLDQLLKDSRRSASRVAVISIELNRFGYLNETYGHEVGDALMVAAGGALADQLHSDEMLVRYSGPQFVVAAPDIPDPSIAMDRARQILDALERAYQIGPDRIRLSANAGLVLTDQQYASADDVLLDSHVALQHAMREGAGVIALFDSSMRSRYSPSAAEHRLREALDRGQFWLLYLPVVRVSDNRLAGAEALLRWADPETGLVTPSHFLESLEETGLILPVGAWVLREACRQAKEWDDLAPGSAFEVTVNVSPRQLLQSDFLETVQEALDESGVDPGRMCLELTEGSLLRDVESAWSMLREVKALGLRLALDDFGTGSSSLSYLRRFRLDSLKIDSAFVAPIVDSREDEAIVQQLIGLAHALGMEATAEGVETHDQLKVLQRLGCDQAQGYYFSTPQPPDVIERMLAKGRLERVDRPTEEEDLASIRRRATIVPPDVER